MYSCAWWTQPGSSERELEKMTDLGKRGYTVGIVSFVFWLRFGWFLLEVADACLIPHKIPKKKKKLKEKSVFTKYTQNACGRISRFWD